MICAAQEGYKWCCPLPRAEAEGAARSADEFVGRALKIRAALGEPGQSHLAFGFPGELDIEAWLEHTGLENERVGQPQLRNGRQRDGIDRHAPVVVFDLETHHLRCARPEA